MTKRTLLITLLLATVAVGGYGQEEALTTIAPPPHAPRTVAEAVERIGGPRASVIGIEGTDYAFIIPVAGNAAGGAGTYFKSDVVFNNDRLAEQRIAVGWMAQGANNCTAPLQYFVLSANTVTVADDFVGRNLGQNGIGALLVSAVDSAGNVDSAASIDGYSRIWTPQPGSAGTVSQNFAAVDVKDSIGSLTATLMGLKQSAQFRANVGIVNMDNVAAHTWTFTSLANRTATTLTVQPCSMLQVPVSVGSASATGNLAFEVKSNGYGFWWSGFGSSTDNVTGDGWVSRATQ